MTLAFLGAVSLFNPTRSWVASAKRHPEYFILLALLFTGIFLTPDPNAVSSVNDIDRYRLLRIVLITALASFVWLMIILDHFRVGSPGSTIYWMLGFSLFAMSSYFYSVNPLLSLWKGFEVFTVTSTFLYLSPRIYNAQQVYDFINVFSLIILYLVISSLVGAVVAPNLALTIQTGGIGGAQAYAYQGVFPAIQANSLAQIGAMVGMLGLIHCLYKMESSNRAVAGTIFLLGVLAMLMAHSRTSIIGFATSTIFLLAFGQRKLLGFVLASIIFGLAILVPQLYEYAEAYIIRGQTKDAFSTLSGRMNFWPDVIEAFWLSPAVGHGYYAGHRDLVVEGRRLLQYSSVDNTYLEVLVDLGILGLIFLVSAVTSIVIQCLNTRPNRVKHAIRREWKPYWFLLTGFFLIIMIRSLTGPTFQVYHPNLILFLLISLCLRKFRLVGYR